MREIKFRFWTQTGYDENDEQVYEMTKDLAFEEYAPLNDLLKSTEFPLMQYTGLKDKNGKEIYEGDILNDGAVVAWFDKLVWDSCGSLHSGWYCKKWLDFGNELNWHEGFNDVEVIGNLYENPELINKK